MRQEFKYGSLCGEIRCITPAKNNLRGRSSKLGARTRTAHTHFSTSKRVYNPGDGRSRAIVRSSVLRSRARYTRRGSGGLRSKYSLLLLLLFPLRPNATRHRRLPQLTVTPHSPFSTLEALELGRWPGPWLSSLLGRTVCRKPMYLQQRRPYGDQPMHAACTQPTLLGPTHKPAQSCTIQMPGSGRTHALAPPPLAVRWVGDIETDALAFS